MTSSGAAVINTIKWPLLSEAVFLLIREANADTEAEAMIRLLEKRRPLSCFYDSASHVEAKYGADANVFWLAVGAEEAAAKDLCSRLQTARVRGWAYDANGVTLPVSDKDWSVYHISVSNNRMFSPLAESLSRTLYDVRICADDLFKVRTTSLFKRKSAAAVSACEKWLVGLRRGDDRPPRREDLEIEAIARFNISAWQFRGAYKAAADEAPNRKWGKGGRPSKP